MKIKTWVKQFEEKFGKIIAWNFPDDDPENSWDTWPAFNGLSIEQKLEVEFYDGFGGEENPPFYAYSETHVMFVTHYDGSTNWGAVPRNPNNERPNMFGGG